MLFHGLGLHCLGFSSSQSFIGTKTWPDDFELVFLIMLPIKELPLQLETWNCLPANCFERGEPLGGITEYPPSPPQIVIVQGVGGVPEYFVSLES